MLFLPRARNSKAASRRITTARLRSPITSRRRLAGSGVRRLLHAGVTRIARLGGSGGSSIGQSRGAGRGLVARRVADVEVPAVRRVIGGGSASMRDLEVKRSA